MGDLNQDANWRALSEHLPEVASRRLLDLFAGDAARHAALSLDAAGLHLDISKQRLTASTLELLLGLARSRSVEAARDAMFAGDVINHSEGRPAWHVALRDPAGPVEVLEVLDRLEGFVDAVRSGEWRGHGGEAITDVVNIGIGGSDLGPRMVCRALAPADANPAVHFVANVDPQDLDRLLHTLDPARTLFVVTSKSFGTAETLANARAARAWLLSSGAPEQAVARHFAAVSTNAEKVAEFGIDTDNMFGFWDWVGGRFSLWSAVGLPIALALGMDGFRRLLDGAHAMDRHFKEAPLEQNLPVWLALVGVWNRNFMAMPGLVVAPYAQPLELFADWLQQLEMESNGKSVSADGGRVTSKTVPAIWGSVGSNAQHAYFQMLHQGTDILPVDFILPLPEAGLEQDGDDRGLQLAANCIAQAEALMRGRDPAALRNELERAGVDESDMEAAMAQRRFEGNRPSSMLVMERLDATHLGALLAAYEHKTFVQGVVWGINSFDQWGVELGKQLAGNIMAEWAGGTPRSHDASTAALMARVQSPGN